MASNFKPGGGWEKGAGAQEESLFRRTTLSLALTTQKRRFYPIPDDALIYTPGAYVFRNSETMGYSYMKEPRQISFVSLAAFRKPTLIKKVDKIEPGIKVLEFRLPADLEEKTRQKINLLFECAEEYKHNTIILSAFGCGSFANPAKHMAEIFRDCINSFRFISVTHIYFAIIDDHNTGQGKFPNPHGNFAPFVAVFK